METENISTSNNCVSPITQLIFIVISFACIATAFYVQKSVFVVNDPLPAIQPYPMAKPENTVTVGLYVDHFEALNMIANRCIVSGILWFIAPQNAEFAAIIEQCTFQRAQVLEKIALTNKPLDAQHNLITYSVRVEFSNILDYTYFPLDDHRLYLVLVNQATTADKLTLQATPTSFALNKDISFSGWELKNQKVTSGTIPAPLDSTDMRTLQVYPAVLFSFDFARAGLRYVITIFFPLLLIFYLIVFALSMNSEASLVLAIAGVTALVSFRFVIESISPLVGYFMLSDYIFFLFLIATFFVFIITIVDSYAKQLTKREKLIALSLLHLLVILVTVYYLVFWI